jgi:SnoaL-like protein
MTQSVHATAAPPLVGEADYVQLSRLVIEHAWRVDNGRADTVHELYVDDGELVVPPAPVRGRQALREWGQRIVQAPAWRSIRHVCGNMRFVTDGADTAEGTTLLTVFMVAGPGAGTTLPWSVGEDHDRFVRTEVGWKLVSRHWVELFTRGDNVPLP